MKVPLSWLNEYVDVSDLSVKELADRLTFSGVEVEGIEEVGAEIGRASCRERVENLVVAVS